MFARLSCSNPWSATLVGASAALAATLVGADHGVLTPLFYVLPGVVIDLGYRLGPQLIARVLIALPMLAALAFATKPVVLVIASDDPGCLEGLQADGSCVAEKKSLVQPYRFDPSQECKLGQDDKVQAVLISSALGFGIGVSVGLLAFYGTLLALGGRGGRWVPVALLALFSGNMLAQSALQLTQADWLQAGPTLWDSSAWLPEQSIAGHLLYALLGYESTPSLAQALAYLAGVAAVAGAALVATLVTPRTERRKP